MNPARGPIAPFQYLVICFLPIKITKISEGGVYLSLEDLDLSLRERSSCNPCPALFFIIFFFFFIFFIKCTTAFGVYLTTSKRRAEYSSIRFRGQLARVARTVEYRRRKFLHKISSSTRRLPGSLYIINQAPTNHTTPATAPCEHQLPSSPSFRFRGSLQFLLFAMVIFQTGTPIGTDALAVMRHFASRSAKRGRRKTCTRSILQARRGGRTIKAGRYAHVCVIIR